MLRYIGKRLLIAIPVLFGVMLIIFLMMNVIPGDPITLMMKEHIKPQIIESLRIQNGLDKPVIVRFGIYLKNVLTGSFGISTTLSRDVGELIAQAFPHTVKLALLAAFVAWAIGIPAGIISALKKGSIIDNFFMGFALVGVSLPIFWAALLFQYVFAFKLGWFDVAGYQKWHHFIMPAVVLGWASSGTIARLTRSSLLEIMKNDYIRTARAKGLRELFVVTRHALKNSMLPVVTIMALQVASLLSGAVITETVFGIPGIGRLAVNAIQKRDMPLLQGTVIFTTALIILGNILADLAYSLLDPRIRYDK